MFEDILKSLSFKTEEAKVYLLLLDTGPMKAGQLARKIGIPRASLYGFLERLQEKGIISLSLKDGVKVFAAEPPQKIRGILRQHIEELQSKEKDYVRLLPEITKNAPLKALVPKFQYFEGVEGVQHVLKDMLLYDDMETQAYWPIKSMLEILSPAFFRYLNKERIKNNLYTRAIWPQNQVVEIKKYPYLGVGEDFKREIRTAPPEVDFSMGYWIYQNKVAFLSSRKECFGFIVESRELAEMLLSQFELLWKISKPIKAKPEDTQEFIQEINKPW
jgi:HTH-type transcriptional regulator, sugar sensing transcriptional regulator